MSNFVGKRPNPLAAAIQGAVKLFGKKQKTSKTIDSITPNVGTLKEFQKYKDKLIKSTDKYTKNLKDEDKVKIKRHNLPAAKKLSEVISGRNKKAKGGRVGLKRGTGLMKKKSDVQKIKETFAPRVSKNKKASKFGMLSVKAGVDKNPNPTQADRIAGAKMKSKKKFV